MIENNWPKQSEVPKYYGSIEIGRDGRPTDRWEARALKQINLPYPMRLAWDTNTTVTRLTCHRQVAASLSRCLGSILQHYGSIEAVRAARMDLFGGVYNFRPIRGSHTLSMHAYGIAIDLDPEGNPLGEKYVPGKMMPQAVVDIFEEEGWTWGGRWKGRPDCQHFQAATV